MNSSTLPSAMMCPLPMTSRWSAVWAISLMRWLDRNTVRPSDAKDFIRLRIHTIPSGSRPLMGSSNITVSGSPSRAAAIPSRWLMPSEKVPSRLAGDVGEPDEFEHLADPPAVDAVAIGEPSEVVGGGPATVDGLGVEQRAQGSEGVGQLPVRSAVDADGACGRCVQAEDHPHGGRLAGAVWTEEAGHSARPDDKGDFVDRNRLAVALGEVVCLDHGPSFRRLARIGDGDVEVRISWSAVSVLRSRSNSAPPSTSAIVQRRLSA